MKALSKDALFSQSQRSTDNSVISLHRRHWERRNENVATMERSNLFRI